MVLQRDGKVGGGFYTRLIRSAKNSREVKDVISAADNQFGKCPWQILAAGAHVSAGPLVQDSTMAGQLLARLIDTDLPLVSVGVFRAVLGKASYQRNLKVCEQAFKHL